MRFLTAMVTGAVPGAIPARRQPDGERSRAGVDGADVEGTGMETGLGTETGTEMGTEMGTGMRMGVLPPSRPTPVSTATLSAAGRPRPAPRLGQWRGGARPARR